MEFFDTLDDQTVMPSNDNVTSPPLTSNDSSIHHPSESRLPNVDMPPSEGELLTTDMPSSEGELDSTHMRPPEGEKQLPEGVIVSHSIDKKPDPESPATAISSRGRV